MYKVIIADDEEIIRKRLITRIDWQSMGFEIAGEACNGAEVVALMEKLAPDVVVTDIRMPLMDGIKLMEQLAKDGCNTEVIAISGYAEFEYARQMLRFGAFDYILKPIEKEHIADVFRRLKEKLEEKEHAYVQLRNRFITDAAFNRLKDEEIGKLSRKFRLGSIPFGMMILFADEVKLHSCVPDLPVLFREGVNKYIGALPVRETGSNVVYFVEIPEESAYESIAEKIFSHLNEKIEDGYGFSVSLYYTAVSRDIACLPGMLRLTGYVNEIRHFDGGKTLKGPITENSGISEDYMPHRGMDREIIRALNSDDENLLNLCLNRMFDGFTVGRAGMTVIRNECLRLLNTVFGYLNDRSMPDEKIATELKKSFDHIGNYEFAGTLKGYMKELLENLYKNGEREDYQMKSYLYKAKEYINSRFNEELTLEDVSNSIGISYGYLSHIFKSRMNVSFVQYIRMKRIREAEALLQNTGLKIYEIADKIGFKNARHFSDVFKEETGLTPFEFRMKYMVRLTEVNSDES